MNCNQCQMISIQGVACHERGCPNMGSRWDVESETWIKQTQCRECGSMVDRDAECCEPLTDTDAFYERCES